MIFGWNAIVCTGTKLNYIDSLVPSGPEACDGLKEGRREQETNLDLASNLAISLLLTFPTMQQVPCAFCTSKTKAEHAGSCKKESPNAQSRVLKGADGVVAWIPIAPVSHHGIPSTGFLQWWTLYVQLVVRAHVNPSARWLGVRRPSSLRKWTLQVLWEMQLNTTRTVTYGVWPPDDLPPYYGKIRVLLRPKLFPSCSLEKQSFGSVSKPAQALCLSPCSPSPRLSSFPSDACCLQAEKGK